MLPTGNAIVQDVLDYMQGIRPSYDFSRDLAYDPALLSSDYLFMTTASVAASEPFDEGAVLVRDISAQRARALLGEALETDAASFMVAFPQEG